MITGTTLFCGIWYFTKSDGICRLKRRHVADMRKARISLPPSKSYAGKKQYLQNKHFCKANRKSQPATIWTCLWSSNLICLIKNERNAFWVRYWTYTRDEILQITFLICTPFSFISYCEWIILSFTTPKGFANDQLS